MLNQLFVIILINVCKPKLLCELEREFSCKFQKMKHFWFLGKTSISVNESSPLTVIVFNI